jgi:hypothetical protein
MLSRMKDIHSPLYMIALTWFCVGMAFLDWMHSRILLGIAFSIHSRFYCISGIHRPSYAMD